MGRRPSFNYSQTDPKILEMYEEEGLSCNEIAKRLELYPTQVKRRLEAMGVETRDLGESLELYHRLNKTGKQPRQRVVRQKTKKKAKKTKKGKSSGSKKAKEKPARAAKKSGNGGSGSKGKKGKRVLRRRGFRRSKGQE